MKYKVYVSPEQDEAFLKILEAFQQGDLIDSFTVSELDTGEKEKQKRKKEKNREQEDTKDFAAQYRDLVD